MLPDNRVELIEELNATEERYVRKKLALEGYVDWQKPVVQHWLVEREAMRQESAARSRSRGLWARIFLGACGAIATVAYHFRGL